MLAFIDSFIRTVLCHLYGQVRSKVCSNGLNASIRVRKGRPEKERGGGRKKRGENKEREEERAIKGKVKTKKKKEK